MGRLRARAGKPIIGLAGGIGSGKSTVAAVFGELGAGVISSDQLNHDELDSPEVLSELRMWWGDRILDAEGRAARDVIRGIVGSDPLARRRLEQLVHPRIAARRQAMMAEFLGNERIRAIVWDSPLLFEAGLDAKCDFVVFVESDVESRLARVGRERGWTREDLERFEKVQKPLDFKRERADYIVDNNSEMDVVRRRAEDVFSRILTAAKASCG
ncbi:MAG: dephospho-CoA kinase [Planctomycetes bacterium]|nr:dephospho-CoA kinase [Planctomycetota bacterium]